MIPAIAEKLYNFCGAAYENEENGDPKLNSYQMNQAFCFIFGAQGCTRRPCCRSRHRVHAHGTAACTAAATAQHRLQACLFTVTPRCHLGQASTWRCEAAMSIM